MMKKNGMKFLTLLIVLLLALFGMAGCGNSSSDSTSNTGDQVSELSSDEPSSVSSPELSTEPEMKDVTRDVKLTYVNGAYISEGDDSLEKLVTDVPGEVTAAEGDIAAACSEVLKLLKTVPEEQTGLTTVVDQMEISDVTVSDDGTATVDFAAIPEGGLDEYTEQFLIYQITGSLINSFDEISSVQFTVGGQQTETIGGHLDVTSAFTIEDLEAFSAPGASDEAGALEE